MWGTPVYYCFGQDMFVDVQIEVGRNSEYLQQTHYILEEKEPCNKV